MMDALSVITEATKTIVQPLAGLYEVSLTRMYEILGRDCCYPKTKKLIRRIASLNQSGGRLVKADLDALFCEILNPVAAPPRCAEMHRELNDVIHASVEQSSARQNG